MPEQKPLYLLEEYVDYLDPAHNGGSIYGYLPVAEGGERAMVARLSLVPRARLLSHRISLSKRGVRVLDRKCASDWLWAYGGPRIFRERLTALFRRIRAEGIPALRVSSGGVNGNFIERAQLALAKLGQTPDDPYVLLDSWMLRDDDTQAWLRHGDAKEQISARRAVMLAPDVGLWSKWDGTDYDSVEVSLNRAW